MDALAIDRAFASEQRVNAAIAVAWMLLSQLGNLCKQRLLIWAHARLILKGGTVQLCKQAGAPHRDSFGRQEPHRVTLLGDGHSFLRATL